LDTIGDPRLSGRCQATTIGSPKGVISHEPTTHQDCFAVHAPLGDEAVLDEDAWLTIPSNLD
jgi:hypothetical protein